MIKPNQRFPADLRLKSSRDFDRVFERRCSAGDTVLVIYAAPNCLPYPRIGIVVGKSVGPAVKRNYAKRRIREAFRKNKELIPLGFDFVCVAKPPAANRKIELSKSLMELMLKAIERCLKQSQPRIGGTSVDMA